MQGLILREPISQHKNWVSGLRGNAAEAHSLAGSCRYMQLDIMIMSNQALKNNPLTVYEWRYTCILMFPR